MRRRAPHVKRPLWTTLTALAAAAALSAGLAGPAQAGDRTPRSAAGSSPRCSPAGTWATPSTPSGPTRPRGATRASPRQLLDEVRENGFRSVRIPVTLGQHEGPAPDVHDRRGGARPRRGGRRLGARRRTCPSCSTCTTTRGCGPTQMPTRHDEVLAQFTATWDAAGGARSATDPRTLLFESINEPQFAGVDRRRAGVRAARRAQHRVPPGRARVGRRNTRPRPGAAHAAHRLGPGPARRARLDVRRAATTPTSPRPSTTTATGRSA